MSYFRHHQITAILMLTAASQLVALPSPASGQTVRLAGRPVFTINNAEGSMSAAVRAEEIQSNLDNAIVASVQKGGAVPVAVIYAKGQPVVTVGGYYVCTVSDGSAAAAKTTPARLAQLWANNIKAVVSDNASLETYAAQLTSPRVKTALKPTSLGSPIAPAGKSTKVVIPRAKETAMNANRVGTVGGTTEMVAPPVAPPNTRLVYLPAGLTLIATLDTRINAEAARPGDFVQATLSRAMLVGDADLPAGTVITGHVADLDATNAMLGLGANRFNINFETLRLPDGSSASVTARIIGALHFSGSTAAYTPGSGEMLVFSRSTKLIMLPGQELQLQLQKPVSVAISTGNNL